MYKKKKENTTEEVLRRIDKLRETVDTLNSVADDYQWDEIDFSVISTGLNHFLAEVGFEDVKSEDEESSLEKRLGVVSQNTRDIVERTYRLASKVMWQNYERSDPVLALASTINFFRPVKRSSADLTGLMNTFSDSLTHINEMRKRFKWDEDPLGYLMGSSLSSIVNRYDRAYLEAIPEEKVQVQARYAESVADYLNDLEGALARLTTRQQLTASEVRGAIDDSARDKFNYTAKRDQELEGITAGALATLGSDYQAALAAGNGSGADLVLYAFERRHGSIVEVEVGRTKKQQQAKTTRVSISTKRNSNYHRHNLNLSRQPETINHILITLIDRAKGRSYDDNPRFQVSTLQARDRIDAGWLQGNY